jgi:hypothetical protein
MTFIYTVETACHLIKSALACGTLKLLGVKVGKEQIYHYTNCWGLQ